MRMRMDEGRVYQVIAVVLLVTGFLIAALN